MHSYSSGVSLLTSTLVTSPTLHMFLPPFGLCVIWVSGITCDFLPLQATGLPATSPLELVSQAIPNGKGDDLWEPLYADRQPGGVPLVIQPLGVYLKVLVRHSSPLIDRLKAIYRCHCLKGRALQLARSSAAETITSPTGTPEFSSGKVEFSRDGLYLFHYREFGSEVLTTPKG